MHAGMRMNTQTPSSKLKTWSINVKFLSKLIICCVQNSWNIFQIQNDQLAMFRYDLKQLTQSMSIPNIVLNAKSLSST